MTKIKKAVIPIAGYGTRLLPITKALPKEMLPIIDKPVIHYIVEEAFSSGIEQIIFITGRHKTIIENYFDIHYELNDILEKNKDEKKLLFLNETQSFSEKFCFVRQQRPLGLGHAVWRARDLIGNEPFALLLPDMVMKGKRPCLNELVELHAKYPRANLLSVQECKTEEVVNYGIIQIEKKIENNFKISSLVEKPKIEDAPSNFYISGRYILQSEIFSFLEMEFKNPKGEIQLTDAMKNLIKEQDFYSHLYDGKIFDCGSKLGFLEANIAFSLDQTELRENIIKMIKDD